MTLRLALSPLVLVVLSGCTACEPLEPLSLPDEHCQPLLAGADCMLPYPSDFFRKPDNAMAGGFGVVHEGSAKLLTTEEYSADVNDWRPTDGFSRAPPILALLGSPVKDEGLVHIFDDKAPSARADSKTVIIDAETGAFVPHFVDLDPRATDDSRRAIVLRPEVMLEERRRYVVALKGLVGEDGEEAQAPEGFRRLRDGRGAEEPALAALQQRFDDEVFPVLAEAGVDRSRLQLAWDFTTGADAHIHDDMLRARELALAWLEDNAPVVVITGMQESADDPLVWRNIDGYITGPSVMAADVAGGELARDDEGRVKLNGETTFEFRAVVPASLRGRFAPGLLLHYGHGFFGGLEEVDGALTLPILDELGAVTFAIDWIGMSSQDLGEVVSTIGDEVHRSASFTDRVPQAMVNWLVLTAAIAGSLQDAPELRRPDDAAAPGVVVDPENPTATNAGALLYEPGRTHFLGISMGHILGGTLAALNPALERVVLHVGGAALTQMMFRALPFERFLFIMDYSLPDPLDQQKLAATLTRHFDRIDPITWARYVVGEELPSGPPGGASSRRVLLQPGIADTQVPNFATYLHARALGVPLVTPQVESVWGLEERAAPHDGSGLFQFDLGLDASFYEVATPPPEQTLVHDELRQHAEPIAQMSAFFAEGRIISPCGGPCTLTPLAD